MRFLDIFYIVGVRDPMTLSPPTGQCRANSTVIKTEYICDINKGTRYVPKLSKNVYWKKKIKSTKFIVNSFTKKKNIANNLKQYGFR